MYCIHCGSSIPEKANYCPNCGKQIVASNNQTLSLDYYKEIINFEYRSVELFSSIRYTSKWFTSNNMKRIAYLKVKTGHQTFLLDFLGSKVFSESYDDIISMCISNKGTEHFVVKKLNKCAIRTKDAFLTRFEYESIDLDILNELGFAIVKNKKYGIVNLDTGDVLFNCIFDGINGNHRSSTWPEDYILAQYEGKYGVIGLKPKNIIIPFTSDEPWDIYNISIPNHYDYITRTIMIVNGAKILKKMNESLDPRFQYLDDSNLI